MQSAREGTSLGGELAAGFRSAQRGIFRKEGEYWTVGYGANTFRLRETRGLGYIAHLLRHPDVEFHVLDLSGGIADREEDASQAAQGLPRSDEDLETAGIQITGLGDAGEMLDEQAKAAYRRRLSELREELEDAKAAGRVDRAEKAEQEFDALTKELGRAVGLGGRNRRAASASERARQSITKSIKSVLERIAQSDAALGSLLSGCIKTGTFCAYRSDPNFPIAWEFAQTIFEPVEQPDSTSQSLREPTVLAPAPPITLDVSPFSLGARTAFVGREAERGVMRAAIDRALSGHGSLVMLAGGPGVGKTRLAMEMTEYASRVGFRCFTGHCYERDEPFPYLPFVEMIESMLVHAASLDDFRRRMGDNAAELAQIAPGLRRVFPDLPQPVELPPAQKRRFLFQSLSEALARGARSRSFVYTLEDLHWADESTLALLTHLADRITQLPVVIIGTYRDGYLDNNQALVRTIEELIRRGIRPLKVDGLSKDAVAQMLQALSKRPVPEGLTDVIFEESQGNPFFVEELYRHLVEEGKMFAADGQLRADLTIDEIDVPENVRLIVGRRLERLNDDEKRVLGATAVIGRSFSFQLLAEISQVEIDDLFAVIEKAQQMGIIVPSAEGPESPFTFSHELVRQTLLSGISAPRQQRLHTAIADAIERLHPGAAVDRAGEIADHLLKAGPFVDKRKLIHHLTLAGKAALEAAAFREARRSFRSALSHLTDADERERAELLANVATAERGLERWDKATAHLDEALEIYIKLGDREKISRSSADLTEILVWAGRLQEGIDRARRGIAYLESDLTPARARLLARLAQAQATMGDYAPADAAMHDALSIAAHLSDEKLKNQLCGSRSIVNYQFLRLREAVADGEVARGTHAPPWERAVQLQVHCQTLMLLGRLEEAARVREELEPLATRIGQSYSIARSLITQAWVDFGKSGDLAALESGLRIVLQPDPKMPFVFWDVFSIGQLSLVDFLRGNWSSALHLAQESCRREVETSIRGSGAGMLFRQLAYEGKRGEALALLNEKRDWLPQRGQTNPMGSWWMLALTIEGLAVLGEHSLIRELYPMTADLLATGAVALWPIFRSTHTVAGIAAASAHDWATAEEHFQTALRDAVAAPLRLEQAEARRFHAMMLMERKADGDRERVRGLLAEAGELYRQIGTRPHFDITQKLLG